MRVFVATRLSYVAAAGAVSLILSCSDELRTRVGADDAFEGYQRSDSGLPDAEGLDFEALDAEGLDSELPDADMTPLDSGSLPSDADSANDLGDTGLGVCDGDFVDFSTEIVVMPLDAFTHGLLALSSCSACVGSSPVECTMLNHAWDVEPNDCFLGEELRGDLLVADDIMTPEAVCDWRGRGDEVLVSLRSFVLVDGSVYEANASVVLRRGE